MRPRSKDKKPAAGAAVAQVRKGTRVLIVEAGFYAGITEALVAGAVAALDEAGCAHERIAVPGALEIPQALRVAADAGLIGMPGTRLKFDGAVAAGCVIRGETSHYDIVCNLANHWLMQIATERRIPVGNAILTVDTEKQAWARSEGGSAGKGGDAARACLALIALAQSVRTAS